MKLIFYTLTKQSLEKMGRLLPGYVIKRGGQEGCFTLGAVQRTEDEKELFVGMCQFLINKVTDTEVVAELAYIYVCEEYRRKGAGLSLLNKLSSILQRSEIKKSLTILVGEEAEILGYGVSEEELGEFLRAGDYLPTTEFSEFWDMAERKLFGGISDILVTNSKKYIKNTYRGGRV